MACFSRVVEDTAPSSVVTLASIKYNVFQLISIAFSSNVGVSFSLNESIVMINYFF